jgi:glucosamine-6-phosphate isomerase
MQVKIFEDYDTLSQEVASTIIHLVKKQPRAILCLAAGDTPRLAYSLLVEKARAGEIDFSKCTFIGLDEWIGIAPTNPGSCRYFLQTNLFTPIGIRSSQIHLFDALSPDLASECRKMDQTIREKQRIDLMLVGVGMNGHIGFNEPGAALNQYAHVISLDETTQTVGQKYFTESTKLQKGITLGLQHLLDSRTAIMIASGSKKAEIIRKALEEPITTQVPASVVRKHEKGLVMLDQDAASLLQRKISK